MDGLSTEQIIEYLSNERGKNATKYINRKNWDEYIICKEQICIEEELKNHNNELEKDIKILNESLDSNLDSNLNRHLSLNERKYVFFEEFVEIDSRRSHKIEFNDDFCMVSYSVNRTSDILKQLWINLYFDKKNTDPSDLFDITFQFIIGYNIIIEFNMLNILLNSLLYDIPIEENDNYIKIPVLLFDKMFEYGLPLVSFVYNECKLQIICPIKIYNFICKTFDNDFITLVNLNLENNKRLDAVNKMNVFSILHIKKLCDYTNNGNYINCTDEIIDKDIKFLLIDINNDLGYLTDVAIKINDSEPLIISDFIEFEFLSKKMYLVCLIPDFTDIKEVKNAIKENIPLNIGVFIPNNYSINVLIKFNTEYVNDAYLEIYTIMATHLKFGHGLAAKVFK